MPAPRVVLRSWPKHPCEPWLELSRLPQERADRLSAHLPAREQDAWEHARSLLAWAGSLWRHDGFNAAPDADALEILERGLQGERFRCVEYARVLAAALNARHIPARVLTLRQHDYQEGLGRSHVVAEAWIDPLNRWVLFDPQNSAYWVEGSVPLSGLDLLHRHAQGGKSAEFVTADGSPAAEADFWREYFAHIQVGGSVLVRTEELDLWFQGVRPLEATRLLSEPDCLYPDLSGFTIGLASVEGVAALRLGSSHPYVTGFVIDNEVHAANPLTWVLRLDDGSHSHEISPVTPWGRLAAGNVAYDVEWAAGG